MRFEVELDLLRVAHEAPRDPDDVGDERDFAVEPEGDGESDGEEGDSHVEACLAEKMEEADDEDDAEEEHGDEESIERARPVDVSHERSERSGERSEEFEQNHGSGARRVCCVGA